jgi:hypothetical protein
VYAFADKRRYSFTNAFELLEIVGAILPKNNLSMKNIFFRSLIVNLDTSRLSVSPGRSYTANALRDKDETPVTGLAFVNFKVFGAEKVSRKTIRLFSVFLDFREMSRSLYIKVYRLWE